MQQGKLLYWQPLATPTNNRPPDITIEFHDGSIGMHIPQDGNELNYFSRAEALMLANALAVFGNDD